MVTGRLSQSNRETERLESQGVDAAVYRRRIGLGLCAQASSNGGLSAGKQETRSRYSYREPSKLQSAVASRAPAGSLYKLRKTPAGKALFTYTAAVLKVTGMDQGKVYRLSKFLGNFAGHVQAGRIQKVPGGYQLTARGIDYFNDLYSPGNRQHIERTEVEAMVRLIRSGGGPDWVPVD
jgi:hypothetical protein